MAPPPDRPIPEELSIPARNETLPPDAPQDARIPAWGLALMLMLAVTAIDGPFNLLRIHSWGGAVARALTLMALFVPGAFHRHKPLQAVVLVAAALAAWGLDSLATHTLHVEHWAWPIAAGAVVLCLLPWTEMFFTGRPSWPAMLWGAAAVLAVSAVTGLALQIVTLCDADVALRHFSGNGRWPLWPYAANVATAVLIWLAVPAAHRAATGGLSRRGRIALAAGLAVPIAVLVIFQAVVAVPMARTSLEGNGPFTREEAVRLLGRRGSDADIDRILQTVLSQPWDRSQTQVHTATGWRRSAVMILSRRGGTSAAKQLAQFFMQRPSEALAADLAPLFAEHAQYQSAPLLMRYALEDPSSPCPDALAAMGVHQATLPILRRILIAHVMQGKTTTPQVPPDVRAQLTALLGEDAGPSPNDWFNLYDRTAATTPSPLPPDVRIETDRVVELMSRYFRANDAWAAAAMRTAQRAGVPIEGLRAVAGQLFASIPPPDWTVPTTDALENQINAYIQKVTTALQAQTQPAGPPTPIKGDPSSRLRKQARRAVRG